MFKTAREEHESTERGNATRDLILDRALRLFRKRGFERTTMREIARAAKVSLGAAYYYFPSKEALAHAFYERVQQSHQQKVEAACQASGELVDRVRATLLSKLDAIQEDRALLGALFRFVGEADHPLSVFGESTSAERAAAISTFAYALSGLALPADLRDAAARALWLAHLGLILHFIHDRSAGQQRTRRLAGHVAELFCTAMHFASVPGASLVLKPLLDALAEAGLTQSPPDKTEVVP